MSLLDSPTSSMQTPNVEVIVKNAGATRYSMFFSFDFCFEWGLVFCALVFSLWSADEQPTSVQLFNKLPVQNIFGFLAPWTFFRSNSEKYKFFPFL